MKEGCRLCPRECYVNRTLGERGFCRMGDMPVVARAALHFGEEPCISGDRGSGTVFFSGCTLQCVFCQNRAISAQGRGREVTVERLAEMFSELEAQGAHNINLVTGTHFAGRIVEALRLAKPSVPVVWNTSGYESGETLKLLEGYVQVYMPDYKYTDADAARRYSAAADYPETARAAILEMYRQTGPYVLDGEGMLKSGVLLRHLILPGRVEDALDVIDWAAESFPKNGVLFSLMSQYTPLGGVAAHPELDRRLTMEEYSRAGSYLELSGIGNGYFQELTSATEEMIPDFDLTGV